MFGGAAPTFDGVIEPSELKDAYDIDELRKHSIIVTAQGGGYTEAVHPKLRAAGWDGLWIDAASTLRMNDDSIIVLDPINRDVIDRGLASGVKDFVGGNCTVSCLLMGLGALQERPGRVGYLHDLPRLHPAAVPATCARCSHSSATWATRSPRS